MTENDVITVGLSESENAKLDDLKEMGVFAEKMDGYRFAVALAVAQGIVPKELTKRTTVFNVGSLDPDQTIRRSVEALMAGQLVEGLTVYRLIERLADWGVHELYAQAKARGIDFVELLSQVAAKTG